LPVAPMFTAQPVTASRQRVACHPAHPERLARPGRWPAIVAGDIRLDALPAVPGLAQAAVAEPVRRRWAFMPRSATDQAQPLEVLRAHLRHLCEERIQRPVGVGARPSAVAVLAARAQRCRGVLGHVLTAADRTPRVAKQRVLRRRHEPAPLGIPAALDQRRQINELGQSARVIAVDGRPRC
jgi:hypothetical protein